ncbi:FecR family protein [Pedobacter cryoconitis]|uniref:FecR family protein n=1 Tax=Pedobacter cryoconitis TaxID=188932 RepID=A0A327T272_9SPHI|nr:FecR domain-containing protein [Pedobacter cryoconitis]RAJ35766.1 FecR family protein [Pedobacter cryoconitis]
MDQENWKFVIAYLAAKENNSGDVQEIERQEKKIQEWLSKDPGHQQELEQALWLWENTSVLPENEQWRESFSTIQASLIQEVPQKTIKFKFWLAAVAAIAAITLFSLFYKVQQPVLQQTSIAWITKSASSGKIINVILPDSTQIWLNSGSSISYPENLRHADLRTVRLKGEAFFKVKRDPAHPFVVYSLNIQTRVLGTSFNIRAWQGHQTEVTVLTGKVAVSRDSAGIQSAAIHLLPNQKAIANPAKLQLENVEDGRTATSWTEGKMVFDQLPVKEVFEALERKYAVKVIADQSFKDCKLTAKFNNVSLNEVLQTIQLSLDIHYTINKQTIYIKGGKCN